MRPIYAPSVVGRLCRFWLSAGTLTLALACAAANVTDPNADDQSPGMGGEGELPSAPEQPAGSEQPVDDAPVDANGQPKATGTGLRSLGRANAQNVLSWSGAAIEIAFAGTQLSVSMTPLAGDNYLGVTVDQKFDSNVLVSANVPLVIGPLANGNHVVRLTKLNEARLGVLRWMSIAFDGNAMTPVAPSRRIEVVGDSIASAYGIDGNGPACSNTSATENALKAFPALLASAFGADVSVISYAGRGLLRNDLSDPNTTKPVMPSLWSRTTAGDQNEFTWTQTPVPKSRRPAAVVIMLGTNDYEYTAEDANRTPQPQRAPLDQNAFVAAGVSFVKQVQSAYPDAQVLLCGSPLLQDSYPTASDQQHTNLNNNLQAIAFQAGVSALDIPSLVDPNHTQTSGCGGHPNRQGHQAIANAIQSKLGALLGW